ncbi:MAG: IS110 family transposase [Bacteroidia bacterium]|nr:IS110 family transposase [Bacteroidia bacterium]
MGKEKTVYIGIDVSKGYADFIVLNQEKKVVESNFQLDDNHIGHSVLHEKITSLNSSGFKVVCGLESTGGYEQNWIRCIKQLTEKKLPVEQYKLNARGVKHQLESELRRTITDGVSAEGIAIYVINNYATKLQDWKRGIAKEEVTTGKQMLCKLIVSQQKHLTAKYNQLEKMIYRQFPELLQYCKNGIPLWVTRLLEKYPSLTAVKNAKLSGVDKIKGITEAKANILKGLAKNSVGNLTKDPIMDIIIQTLCSEILHTDQQIDKLKEQLIAQGADEDVQLLCSIKGVAQWSAIGLLVHLGDIHQFDSGQQLASFFGVHPIFKQSGDGKWGSKMSKAGNKTMRSVLYNAAVNVVQHNPYFKDIYARHRAKGKKHKAVVGIIMHKLLRVVYGILKHKQPFNEQTDIINQEKSHQNEQNETIKLGVSKTSRRYQHLGVEAPVSGRNYKKRKIALEGFQASMDASTESPESNLMEQT